MSFRQPILVKISVLFGVFAPIIAFSCIALAIYHSPWFTWTGNWLSDLGGMSGETPIWTAHGIASVFFNFGLIMAGVMGVVFACTIRKIRMFNSRLGRIGTTLIVIDMFALCFIGVFPETTGYLHTLAALVFFFSAILSLLVIGTVIKKSSRVILGWFVTLLGVISFCSFPLLIIPRPWGSNAIAEMFPIISISMFAIVLGIGLLKDKFELCSEC